MDITFDVPILFTQNWDGCLREGPPINAFARKSPRSVTQGLKEWISIAQSRLKSTNFGNSRTLTPPPPLLRPFPSASTLHSDCIYIILFQPLARWHQQHLRAWPSLASKFIEAEVICKGEERISLLFPIFRLSSPTETIMVAKIEGDYELVTEKVDRKK